MATTEEQRANAIIQIRKYIEDARKLDRDIKDAARDLEGLVDDHAKVVNHIEDELAWLDPECDVDDDLIQCAQGEGQPR